jgi:hypothetical protein
LNLYPYRIDARVYADLISFWYFLRRLRYGCLLSLTAEVFFTWFSPRAIFQVVSHFPPSAFLQLGMLVLRRCSALAWLSSGADGRLCRVAQAAGVAAAVPQLCRAAQAADVAAAEPRRRPDQQRRRGGGVLAGMNLTTYGVLLLAAERRSADDLCGAARRPAHPLGYGRA